MRVTSGQWKPAGQSTGPTLPSSHRFCMHHGSGSALAISSQRCSSTTPECEPAYRMGCHGSPEAGCIHILCVGPRGASRPAPPVRTAHRRPIRAPHTHSAEAPGRASQHKEPTGHAKPAGHALLLSASLQVKPSGHRSGMAQSTHEWGVVSVTAATIASIWETCHACCTFNRGGGQKCFFETHSGTDLIVYLISLYLICILESTLAPTLAHAR